MLGLFSNFLLAVVDTVRLRQHVLALTIISTIFYPTEPPSAIHCHWSTKVQVAIRCLILHYLDGWLSADR